MSECKSHVSAYTHHAPQNLILVVGDDKDHIAGEPPAEHAPRAAGEQGGQREHAQESREHHHGKKQQQQRSNNGQKGQRQ